MYVSYLQFKYQLNFFYLNQYFLSLLCLIHLSQSLSSSISDISNTSEIQDCIYCGHSIKAEAKVHLNIQPPLIILIFPISLNLQTTLKSRSSMNLTDIGTVILWCLKFRDIFGSKFRCLETQKHQKQLSSNSYLIAVATTTSVPDS